MQFNKITSSHIQFLNTLLGKDVVFIDNETLNHYSHDETEDLSFLPEVVLKPNNSEQISSILKFCSNHDIPVTTRGGGTGLSGAALPVYGGILLSTERLNTILNVDTRNLQIVVESGVITQYIMDAAEEIGMMYPVDPSSKGSCFIGGNIAHGSGGPRVVKYGTIRDYILNLEVVLPNGDIIWTGSNTLKYASGYNLTQLFIGSEGTLGIITKAVLKLIPKPLNSIVLFAEFRTLDNATEAVSAIFRAGQTPSALEFMERAGVEWVTHHESLKFNLNEGIEAYLMIEIDGNNMDELYHQAEKISEVLTENKCNDILLADTAQQKETLWQMRRKLPESVKRKSIYKEEDTVVPRAELPKLLKGIKVIGKKYGFESVCYGHAGDGNLHVNIIKGNMTDDAWENELTKGIREIFELTVALGGTISGEHGIGWVQKEYMDVKYSPVHLELMRNIKKVFDPKGILNPGKIF